MRRSPRLRPLLALAVVLGVLVAACGGGDDGGNGNGNGGTADGGNGDGDGLASLCPLGAIDALDEGAKPVEIVYWHSMTEENLRILRQLTDEFNASQPDVRVRLVNQTSYDDTLTKFRAAFGSDRLPDVAQLEDTATQQMIDSQAVLPAQACIDAEGYDLSDHLPRVVDYYSVEGVLWPMPFNVSNPVLYYNRAAFEDAGLDPDDPPATLDEVREASQAIVDSGSAPHGFALVQNPWFLEMWLAMAGEPYVDNGNGRDGRATEVLFANPTGEEIFAWINDMVRDGLAENVGRAQGNINHYLAVGNRTSAMTTDTSAALGTILAVLGSGQFPGVELGVAPLPGPEGDGGTFVAGGANYIVRGPDPARVEAAWRFVRFLNEPASQATWAATGYIPIRQSATELPAVQDLWSEHPEYRVAYEQLDQPVHNVATAGPVIGDFAGVRDAVEDALEQMLTGGTAPADALARAKQAADAAIADYNARVGG
jgi:sn-glycerol 3-phosphate transport system substrate-binding protein